MKIVTIRLAPSLDPRHRQGHAVGVVENGIWRLAIIDGQPARFTTRVEAQKAAARLRVA